MPRPRRSAARLRSACLVAVLAVAVNTGCSAGKPPEPPPNFLLIVVDCLRADRLGGPPSETRTPNLDRLAADSVVFDNAFSPASWTKPSVASLFTSLYPGQHGLRRVAFGEGDELSTDVLPAELDTLAELLQRNGYATGAVINQVHLQPKFGFNQGFEHFQALRGKSAGRLNRRLLDWLGGLDGSRPFFAYLHYLDLHWPYTSGDAAERMRSWQLSHPPPRRGKRAREWFADLEAETQARAAAELAALYDAEVRFIDTHIGELLAALEDLGVAGSSVIVVTSDHGEGFGEHGHLQHGYAPFEEVIHIPLLIRLPEGESASVTVLEPVSLVDVLPTLLELAGAPLPATAAGRSLVPLWQSDSPRWPSRLIFAEGAETLAARSAQHKLIAGPGWTEIYDLASDPGERHPLDSAACEPECTQLDEALKVYQQATTSETAGAAVALSGDDVEELKDLGYL